MIYSSRQCSGEIQNGLAVRPPVVVLARRLKPERLHRGARRIKEHRDCLDLRD